MLPLFLIFLLAFSEVTSLVPPILQWQTVDYAWEKPQDTEEALKNGDYIAEHNMPNGLAIWKNKLFITVPRWKTGVPSSLNYILINEPSSDTNPLNHSCTALLHPYPNWKHGYFKASKPAMRTSSTVISTFRVHIDKYDRLWVIDNGVMDLVGSPEQVCPPSILVFDLNTDKLIRRFTLPSDIITPESAYTSIVVETPSKDESFAYITDMGSDALVVYDYKENTAWRVEHPFFCHEPQAVKYKVGDLVFYWKDGISSVTLGALGEDGYPVLYFQPTSSTKQFKMSTRLLRNKDVSQIELMNGVEVIGDRGMNTQSTACAYDYKTNVLFFTQVNKNGFACWDVNMPFKKDNVPLLVSDCCLLEFPNDIKVDENRNLWILSNRQSKFLYAKMNVSQNNFRILTAPVDLVIQDTPCERKRRSFSFNNLFARSSWKATVGEESY